MPYRSFPDVDISMRISDIGEMILAVRTTRIMGRPVGARVAIKVIILFQSRVTLGTNQVRAHGHTTRIASGVKDELVRNVAVALSSDVLDVAAL